MHACKYCNECKAVAVSFEYVKNSGSFDCRPVGRVHVKSDANIAAIDTFSSERCYTGTLLL